MSDRKISYLNRTFDDYRQALIDYTNAYYPEIAADLDDASIGSWFIDLAAAIGDNLSFYIDKAYNETNVESARYKSSIYALARSCGLKVPGPSASVTELEFKCRLPVSALNSPNAVNTTSTPSWRFAPIIKQGTRVSTGSGNYFETTEDIDFTHQFNESGESNRNITPYIDANNRVAYFEVTKTCMAIGGITKIYKMVLSDNVIKPFMEIIIPDKGVIGVESIIVKDGDNFQNDPCKEEFSMPVEFVDADGDGKSDTYRFFEVNNLSEQYLWGDDGRDFPDGEPITYEFSQYSGNTNNETKYIPMMSVTKGAWRPVTQKFITEYTDNGYLKIIFGSGTYIGQDVDVSDATFTTQNQISRMINNNFLGKLPKAGMTMFIRYRIGGGASSNVPKGVINNIVYLDAVNATTPDPDNMNLASTILKSISCRNIIPSVSGKDAPTVDEIKNMIKYNSGAQNRCVTIKDYQNRISMMPQRYGAPFRVTTMEENNKIMIYVIMVDENGKLSVTVPTVVTENMVNYLSQYRSVNDYVEIKPGRIINLSFDVDVYISKNYDAANVITNIINKVKDYMDINKQQLGKDVYVSDLEKEISSIDGVNGIIDIRVYNEYGPSYSNTMISQTTVDVSNDVDGYGNQDPYKSQIDLEASDYILNSESDEMFEIKFPDNDIRVRAKVR